MKRTQLRPVVRAVILAVLPALAWSQTSNDALRQAAQLAIDTSPDVTASFNQLRAAIDEIDVAKGGFLPRVDLSAEGGRERNTLRGRFPEDTVSFPRTGATLSVNQLLWDGLATHDEVKRLDHQRMTRYFEFLDATEQAALEAARAYYDELRYRKLVELAEDNYVQHKSIYNQIQSRTKAGVGRGVDSEQANARLALAESNLSTEIANLHDVTARYLRVIGAQPPQTMPEPGLLQQFYDRDARQATLAAISHSPSISAAIENLRASRAQADESKNVYQPKIEARLSTGAGKNYLGNIDERRDSQALIELNWNLYNGGSDHARVKQYAALVESAADQRDKACRDVRQTFSIAHNDIAKLTDQVRILRDNVLSIEKARDAYRQQFDIGQRSLLDLLNSENELYTAQHAEVDAEYDLGIAYARMQAAQGTLTAALGLHRLDQAGDLNQAAKQWSAGSDAAGRCPVEQEYVKVTSRAELDRRAAALDTAAPLPEAPATPSSVLPATAADQGLPAQRLQDWAAAWMAKDVERYMSFYSKDFQATTMSAQRWMQERRRLVGKKGEIDVDISDVHTRQIDPDTIETTFHQAYTSDDYSDDVTKTLTWKRENGRWNIIRESYR
jgi:adhesin transport system outer membrane protein